MTGIVKEASLDEVTFVHQIMLEAFEEYRFTAVPSSALNETLSSIINKIVSEEEKAIIYFENNEALGSARMKVDANSIYFSRLSVRPTARGKGIAKSMLKWIEDYAKVQEKSAVRCRVRLSVPQNIKLYQSVGFKVTKEEEVINPNGFPVKTVVMEIKL